MNLRITSIRSDIIHLVVINKCNIKKCLVFVLSSRFGGGGNRKKSKENSLLYLYGWMDGWMDGAEILACLHFTGMTCSL